MELKDEEAFTNEVRLMIQQGRISVKVGSTDVAVTGFPGAVAFSNVATGMGMLEALDRELPPKLRDRGYGHSAAVFDLMSIALSGGDAIEDLAQLRADRGLKRMLGREVMAPSTAHDYLRRIAYDGLPGLARVRAGQLAAMAAHTGQTTATVDVDASLYRSEGRNARMSYKGERGYMPILAFWDEVGAVIHDDFRNGNSSPGGDALAFLKDTMSQLPASVNKIQVRSDSAWYQAEVLDYCQEQGYGFCIGADWDEAVSALAAGVPEEAWRSIEDIRNPADEEPHLRQWAWQGVHTLNKSARAYRIILIRKERLQGDLFDGPYRHSAIITNMELPLEEQIAWYRRRGQCENYIKELKWDFETRVLPSGDFFVNAVYLRIMTLAYNLFLAMKMELPPAYRPCRLKNLLFRFLAIPALVVRHARRLHLKLPRGHPHINALRTAAGFG